ncbi:MAG: hypothetical protein RR753_04385, partial [Raoultibacter sp.]
WRPASRHNLTARCGGRLAAQSSRNLRTRTEVRLAQASSAFRGYPTRHNAPDSPVLDSTWDSA